MAAPAPRLDARRDGACLVVALGGRWTTGAIDRQDAALAALEPNGAQQARIELAEIDELDTTGAWLVYRTARELRRRGLEVDLSGGDRDQRDLIDTVAAHDVPCPGPPPPAFSPHGIHLSERSDGRLQLLAVQHGGRESVEFFAPAGAP